MKGLKGLFLFISIKKTERLIWNVIAQALKLNLKKWIAPSIMFKIVILKYFGLTLLKLIDYEFRVKNSYVEIETLFKSHFSKKLILENQGECDLSLIFNLSNKWFHF